ncbi:MAG: DUF2493 domain-containing protein [Clostridia bacterium]|nr:DUF2493 domain-containing protein [Clostridia bacterium]
MKYIVVAGCRDFTDYSVARQAIAAFLAEHYPNQAVTFVLGGCRGADSLGERYAVEQGIPVEYHLPQWERYGRGAGPKRNQQMAQRADHILCFWDGQSKGTCSLMQIARRLDKPVCLIPIKPE